jgi:hypothetical protein
MARRATACCRAASAPRRAERACGAGRLALEPRAVRRQHVSEVDPTGVFGRLEYPTPPLLLIDGFIRPALGATPLSQLCRAGSSPLRAALRPNCEPAAVAATAAPLSSTAHPDRTPATRGARRTRASHSLSRRSASVTRCSAARSAWPRDGDGSPSTRWTPPSGPACHRRSRTPRRRRKRLRSPTLLGDRCDGFS